MAPSVGYLSRRAVLFVCGNEVPLSWDGGMSRGVDMPYEYAQ